MRGATPEVNPGSSWDMLDEESSDPDFIPRDASHEPSDEDPDEDPDEQFEPADGCDAGIVKDVDEDSLRDMDIEDLDEIELGIAEFQHAEVAGSDTPPVESDPIDHDLEGRDPDFSIPRQPAPPGILSSSYEVDKPRRLYPEGICGRH